MYLDISTRKILPLLIITIILFAAVAVTFELKHAQYGSTPFYTAVRLALSQIVGYPAYALEATLERGARAIGRAFGFGGAVSTSNPGQAQAIPVLEFHRLVEKADGANITKENFRDQVQALKENGWQTITLSEFNAFMRSELQLPAKSVLLTFDDGTKDSFYAVDPILRAHGFNGVNYIIAGSNIIADEEGSTYYLTTEEIKNMLETGRWEIGSHSFDGHHPYTVDAEGTPGNFFLDRIWREDLGRLETPEEFQARVRDDLERAKAELEERYGVAVDTFAYPFGETGIETAHNFPDGMHITDTETDRVYRYGWLQVEHGEYSYNYPDEDAFIVQRIKVRPEWNGDDLIAHLERGMGKPLPYADDMTVDRGWISSWNAFAITSGLELKGSATSSGASAFLDGTRAWRAYEVRADIDWQGGFASILGALQAADTYRACVFSPGHVRLQSVRGETREVLSERDVATIRHGQAEIGMRIQGSVTECLYEGSVVLHTRTKETHGGIGFQVWAPELNTAHLAVTSLRVRDVSGEPLPRNPIPLISRESTLPSAGVPITAPQPAAPQVPNTGVPITNPNPITPQPQPSPTVEPPRPQTPREQPREPEQNPHWDEILKRIRERIEATSTIRTDDEKQEKKEERRGRNRNRD